MATIQHLLDLDLAKVANPTLTETITEILDSYKNAGDKKDFLKVYQPNIDKAYTLVTKFAPDAIKKEIKKKPSTTKKTSLTSASGTPKEKKRKKEEEKPKPQKKPIQKLSATAYADRKKEIYDELEGCREMIRIDNKQKRALAPPKRPKSTYEKVQSKVLSLGKLIPSNLKGSLEVQRQTKKILMRAHKDILNAWKMTSLRKLEKDQNEIKEVYQEIEAKIKGEE